MKKLFLFPVMLLFALTITACSNSPNGFEEPETEQPETPGNDGDEDNKPEENSMKIKITVGNREVTATMKDNATARDFLSRLPIEVTMNDYAGAEKIFYPEPASFFLHYSMRSLKNFCFLFHIYYTSCDRYL